MPDPFKQVTGREAHEYVAHKGVLREEKEKHPCGARKLKDLGADDVPLNDKVCL